MALKPIQLEWEEFSKAVLPPNASAIQKKEMRKAFFAGAWVLLQQLRFIGAGVPDDEAERHLETIETECKLFNALQLREHRERN